MDEHVHELILYYDHEIGDVLAVCQGVNCGWVYEQTEAEARLNATERLSGEDISLVLFVMTENSIAFNASPERQRIAKAIQAYADILEGK